MSDPAPGICACFGISEEVLRKVALERGITGVDELARATTAGTGCRTCVPDLEKLLEALWASRPRPEAKPATPETIVRDALRPFLQNASWELQLIDVEHALVRIRAIARREACVEAEETLRQFVENRLKEMYRPDAAVAFV